MSNDECQNPASSFVVLSFVITYLFHVKRLHGLRGVRLARALCVPRGTEKLCGTVTIVSCETPPVIKMLMTPVWQFLASSFHGQPRTARSDCQQRLGA